MQTIDLHAHTTASDGTLSPTELIVHAAEEGLTAIGVTDHDTVDGLAEAQRAASELRIELVPGIELAVDFPGGRFHMLGFLIDYAAAPLLDRLTTLKTNRATRNERMARRMAEMGLPITLEEMLAEARGGQVGRPHMAAILVRKGVAGTLQEAFDRFLADGAPAYLPKDKIGIQEGIDLIHAAGGLAVVAHPNTLALDDDALANHLKAWAELGLDGVECFYSQYTRERTDTLIQLAGQAGLLATGGSDYHGANKPHVKLGVVLDGRPAPDALLLAMKERQAELRAS